MVQTMDVENARGQPGSVTTGWIDKISVFGVFGEFEIVNA